VKTILSLASAPAMVLALVSCGGTHAPEKAPSTEAAPVEVRTAAVEMVEVAPRVPLVGSVRARETVVISSKIMSHIRAVHVREGDRVKKGRRLIELDDRELVSAVEAAKAGQAEAENAALAASHGLESAQAQFELAETTHRRFETLLKKESVSRQEYDESAARLRSARAAVKMAESQKEQVLSKRAQAAAHIRSAEVMLGHTTIDAPAAGRVTERLADPGTLAAPGAPLLKIEPAGGFRLEVNVPESQIGSLRVGQILDIEIDALEASPSTARVVEIIPEVDPRSRTFIAKLALPGDAGLRSGLYGRAFLTGASRKVLTVPAGAVIERGQLVSVFTVEDQRARRRMVTLGDEAEGRYEVLSGLRAGEAVIVNPAGVVDGNPVRPSTQGMVR
jgi:RND family efflux transporter MFP subunit